jgi:hypothetical protein
MKLTGDEWVWGSVNGPHQALSAFMLDFSTLFITSGFLCGVPSFRELRDIILLLGGNHSTNYESGKVNTDFTSTGKLIITCMWCCILLADYKDNLKEQ